MIETRFRCVYKTEYANNLVAVRLDASKHELFGKFTPIGEITMTINSGEASADFKPGKVYKVLFEEVAE